MLDLERARMTAEDFRSRFSDLEEIANGLGSDSEDGLGSDSEEHDSADEEHP